MIPLTQDLMKRKMILSYGKKSFNETKQPKSGYFQYWSIRMIYFTKIIAQEHFVYLMFQRHKILSNQKLNILTNSETITYFHTLKSFYASLNPG